jgi:hypothetical protein
MQCYHEENSRIVPESFTPHARFLRQKIDHSSAEFKKARESGAQGVLYDEKKTEGRKSRDTVPLSQT